VDDRSGEAAPPFAPASNSSTTPDTPRDPLSRYRALQVISILLVLGGFLGIWLGFTLVPDPFDPAPSLPMDRAVLVLAAIVGGGLAVVIGLVMNAVRALVVRQPLSAERYRGPSVGVLLLLAIVVSVIVSIAAAGDALAFQNGGEVSVGGALIILTATQVGLVAVAVGFVAIPNALVGVRLLPPLRIARSILLGVGAAFAAWIGVTLLSEILTRLLQLFGREPQPGVVQEAVSRLDPTVLILAVVLVAPVAEELFFRGVVLNAWQREYGERRAVLGSAALFAAIHADIRSFDALIGSVVQVVPIFGLGIALALVCLRTKSLVAPMAMHATFNAISLTLALLARLNGWDIPT
jgi:membrane protease YdiL (CAAX protease family)